MGVGRAAVSPQGPFKPMQAFLDKTIKLKSRRNQVRVVFGTPVSIRMYVTPVDPHRVARATVPPR